MHTPATTTVLSRTCAGMRTIAVAACLLLPFVTPSPAAAQSADQPRFEDRRAAAPPHVDAPAPALVATTIRGIARLPDGTPVENAVIVSSAGGQAVSRADGSFTLKTEVPIDAESLGITAVATFNGVNYTADRLVALTHDDRTFDVDPITLHARGECVPQWVPTFGAEPGMDDWVETLVVFDDGSGGGPALYAAGWFATAGGVSARRIAKWDGEEWSPLETGMDGAIAAVVALTVFDDGSGPALYAGGGFTTAGGATVNHVAKWDGEEWSPLSSGMNNWVFALTVFDDGSGPALYAGGAFTTAGGVTVNRIAKWDGSSWSPLGTGMGGSLPWVRALTVFDDGSGGGPALYAGGFFTTAGGVSASRIAKWDGNQWSPLGSGMNDGVRALAVFDDGGVPALYAGGRFTTAGGVTVNHIAKWDGSAWSALGSGIDDWVQALAVFDDGSGGGPALYAGGDFTAAGNVSARRIAKWDGHTWSPLDSGMNNRVFALTDFDDGTGGGPALYASGDFTAAGGVRASRIAKWDGSQWSPLHSGVSGLDSGVDALTVFDDGTGGGPALYAGGVFTTAGGASASRVVKWDGNEWSPLGSGMNERVHALTVFDDGGGPALYASGNFSIAGGVAVNNIAKWDGSVWSPLGSGTDDTVLALTVFDDGSGGGPALYAGGFFTTAGGVSASRIAKWDGSSWSPLGTGMGGAIPWVFALTVYDDGTGEALYAGGFFTSAGGVGASRIAKWDGESWSSLGSGMNGSVRALTVFDDGSGGEPALYAGGFFTSAGGVSANRIAKWDGSSWSPLGTGMGGDSPWVFALTAFDDGSGDGPALYAGGDFTIAGGVSANRIAKWDGSVWSPLSSGMNERVAALTVFDDGSGGGPALYAGGWFAGSPAGDSYLSKRQGCPPDCPPDWNGDGVVDSDDLFDFLADWAAGNADYNGDGVTDSDDLFEFLSDWSTGC